MYDFFAALFAIIGTVIGSGFISGKEVVVFFSRFGYWSFPCIILSFILFFFLFKIILFKGSITIKKMEKSKLSFSLNLIVCLIFSSAMFAGSIDMARGCGKVMTFMFILILFFLCLKVVKKGAKSLNKFNFILVPIMVTVLIVAIIVLLSKGGSIYVKQTDLGGISIVYSLLYVILNTSNGCVLIAKLGEKLTARQKTRVAFLSALVLSLILTALNIVLLKEPSVFQEDMPLLALFSGAGKWILSVAIMIGCLTTLFSLVYSCSFSMRGLCKNEILIFFVSVILPYLLSLCGFGFIVSQFYPLASVLGIFLLADSFFIPLFKRSNKKVHSRSKHAK